MEQQCLFCNIVSGKIPSFKVYEDNLFIAILDINPANSGHMVLLPKRHISSIMEMQPQEYTQFFLVARGLSLALLEFGAEGVNFLYSMGEAAGQRSPHMLLHIIPRNKQDKVRFVWEPLKLTEDDFKIVQEKLLALVNKNVGSQVQQVPKQPQPQKVIEQKQEKKEEKIYVLEPRSGGYWR